MHFKISNLVYFFIFYYDNIDLQCEKNVWLILNFVRNAKEYKLTFKIIYRVIQMKCSKKLKATTKNSGEKKKHNSENVNITTNVRTDCSHPEYRLVRVWCHYWWRVAASKTEFCQFHTLYSPSSPQESPELVNTLDLWDIPITSSRVDLVPGTEEDTDQMK